MNVNIKQDLCTGCGACSDLVPEIFELTDSMFTIVKAPGRFVPHEFREAVREARDNCPAACIEVEE